MQYKYRLNTVNQTRRLFENTTRPPFETRFNNPQNIHGTDHPTSVSMDFNSGVYLSAVKPALERISEGWQLELNNTMISCGEVSGRNDISGRKVCTKLVMFLTENLHPTVKTKVVLHFYHTSNTLQVQGSHVMSAGVSSPVWLATNLLLPIAASHTLEQTATIEAINAQI